MTLIQIPERDSRTLMRAGPTAAGALTHWMISELLDGPASNRTHGSSITSEGPEEGFGALSRFIRNLQRRQAAAISGADVEGRPDERDEDELILTEGRRT